MKPKKHYVVKFDNLANTLNRLINAQGIYLISRILGEAFIRRLCLKEGSVY